jgi:hypothetical protein
MTSPSRRNSGARRHDDPNSSAYATSCRAKADCHRDAGTKGDRATPIASAGFNSERFDGRNLALPLAALG